jgi:hypothetical protein
MQEKPEEDGFPTSQPQIGRRGVHADLIDSRFAYVAVSRGALNAEISSAPPYLFVTEHCGLYRLGVGLGLLNAGREQAFRLSRQTRKNRLPENSSNQDLYLAVGHRECRFIEDAYRVLAILLDAESKRPPLELSQLAAHQIEEDHRLGPIYLVRRRASSLTEARRVGPAILFASFHYADEPPDPVDLLPVGIAKLTEAEQQLFGRLSFRFDLLLDLLEKVVQLSIDFNNELDAAIKVIANSPT